MKLNRHQKLKPLDPQILLEKQEWERRQYKKLVELLDKPCSEWPSSSHELAQLLDSIRFLTGGQYYFRPYIDDWLNSEVPTGKNSRTKKKHWNQLLQVINWTHVDKWHEVYIKIGDKANSQGYKIKEHPHLIITKTGGIIKPEWEERVIKALEDRLKDEYTLTTTEIKIYEETLVPIKRRFYLREGEGKNKLMGVFGPSRRGNG